MMLKQLLMIGCLACSSLLASGQKVKTLPYDQYPMPKGDLTEMTYTRTSTQFQLWAPTASKVVLNLYAAGSGGKAIKTLDMKRTSDGTWHVSLAGDQNGKFYTFNVQKDNKWLGETPGINAKAVGLNGKRGAIIDLRTTDPDGWESDKAPQQQDIVIYEMHHRDFSISPTSGIQNKGKFLALTERGTKSPEGKPTGIDHLKELGVTHVHLLPSFDFASIDESKLDHPQYNWGYDPLNYNVPEGSYSTNPADPKTRIFEFKQMVKSLHDNGLKVVLDVVYNHTYDLAGSNFERTVPGYFYRTNAEGKPANASGCGNETASERAMMRRFMVESVEYWMKEYHIDGFRFDLMGIHDIETMRAIRTAAERINPDVLIYGEGWAAEAPQLPKGQAAMKQSMQYMPGIATFSDELRDALRGPFSNDRQSAFLDGRPGFKESIKFGIVGGIDHPQVNYAAVNYSKAPWAAQPHQLISYVSCHDDMCLTDRLRASIDTVRTSQRSLLELDLMAQTVVFTSQGIPFIQAGEEVLRTKKMVHNSYNAPDSINAIDWSRPSGMEGLSNNYYRRLIELRREHPAFRLGDADLVRKHLEFIDTPETMVAYRLKDNAGGDKWKDIIVAVNGDRIPQFIPLPQGMSYRVWGGCGIGLSPEMRDGNVGVGGGLLVPARSAVILYNDF